MSHHQCSINIAKLMKEYEARESFNFLPRGLSTYKTSRAVESIHLPEDAQRAEYGQTLTEAFGSCSHGDRAVRASMFEGSADLEKKEWVTTIGDDDDVVTFPMSPLPYGKIEAFASRATARRSLPPRPPRAACVHLPLSRLRSRSSRRSTTRAGRSRG